MAEHEKTVLPTTEDASSWDGNPNGSGKEGKLRRVPGPIPWVLFLICVVEVSFHQTMREVLS